MRTLPLLGTLAARYATRHRGQTLRAILGLLVTTVVLVAGLGIGDAATAVMTRQATERYGPVDVMARSSAPVLERDAEAALAAPDVARATAGAALSLLVPGAAENPDARLADASVFVRGVRPSEAEALGILVTSGGAAVAEPSAGEVVLSEALAASLRAAVGTDILLRIPNLAATSPDAPPFLEHRARVAGIAADAGRSALVPEPVVLLPLADLQATLGTPGVVNLALLRASGDAETLADALRAALPPEAADAVSVSAVKVEAIRRAAEEGGGFSGFIMVMGGFTIIAAIILAVALFGSLAEERRAEMGISRALGLTRAQVALTMAIEGALYTIVAAALGLVLGIGALWAFVRGMSIATAAWGMPPMTMELEPSTLGIALALGILLPLGTIAIASFRYARLDPSRAIRGHPEDARTRRRAAWVGGAILVVVGGLMSIAEVPRLVGLPLALLGLAFVLGSFQHRVARPLSLLLVFAALAHIVWTLYDYDELANADGPLDPLMAMARGLVLTLVLIVLAVASPAPYLLLARLGGAGRGLRSAFISLKYLVSRRVATGLTAAIVALVVVVLTVMGTLMTMWMTPASDDEAGFEIMGESPFALAALPPTLPEDVAPQVARQEFLPRHVAQSPPRVLVGGEARHPNVQALSAFVGVTPSFAESNRYVLLERAAAYATDADAWAAVAQGEAIILQHWPRGEIGVEVGERLSMGVDAMPPKEYVLAGIVKAQWTLPAFLPAAHVREMGQPFSTLVLVGAAPGADATTLAHRLTAELTPYGLSFTSVAEENARNAASGRVFVIMLESFLALGLFVGLSATGFLASRAVAARTREIGTMRAVGFEPADVQRALALESGLTAAIGLVVGIGAGLIVAHSVWWRVARPEGFVFSPPWLLLGAFAVGVLALSAIASRGPARRAARLEPALAVRHVD